MKKENKHIMLGLFSPAEFDFSSKNIFPPYWYKKELSEEEKEIMEESDPDDVILFEGNYNIVIDYPLRNKFERIIKVPKEGLKRKDLAALISEFYQEIYENPELYGVWGHSLDDLLVHGVELIEEDNLLVNGMIFISVDS